MAWLPIVLILLMSFVGLGSWAHRERRDETSLPMKPESNSDGGTLSKRWLPNWLQPTSQEDQLNELPTPDRRENAAAAIEPAVAEGEISASDLAAEFADHFNARELKCPLENFLLELTSARPQGLQGIGLAAWDADPDPSYLGIYALLDETAWPGSQQDDTIANESTTRVIDAHNVLNQQLRIVQSPLSCGLWFVRTADASPTNLQASLREHLSDPDELFVTPLTPNEHIVHLRVKPLQAA